MIAHTRGFEFSSNPAEGMAIYSPGFLGKLDTIEEGFAWNLKLDLGHRRYWLSRAGAADGEEWQVYVMDADDDGRWGLLLSYRETTRGAPAVDDDPYEPTLEPGLPGGGL